MLSRLRHFGVLLCLLTGGAFLGACELECKSDAGNEAEEVIDEIGDEVEETIDKIKEDPK